MTAVIAGPYDREDFRTMQDLKSDLSYMEEKKNPMYKFSIKRERKMLRDLLRKEVA